VEWWLQDKSTASQSVRPVVQCSYASVQRSESGLACGSAVQSTVAAAA
jgi:hypothetical protein